MMKDMALSVCSLIQRPGSKLRNLSISHVSTIMQLLMNRLMTEEIELKLKCNHISLLSGSWDLQSWDLYVQEENCEFRTPLELSLFLQGEDNSCNK